MKNGLLKLIAGTTIAVLGVGVFSGFNQKITQVDATAHTANYSDYIYDGDYYSSIGSSLTEGLNGTLRQELTTLIFPKAWYTYSGSGTGALSSILQSADEDPTNSSNMVYLYTRDSVKKNAASSWNREHVWPRSSSGGCWQYDQAGTDILHIRPTYSTTNSERGNLKFGYENGGNTVTYSDITYGKKGSYFEPIDSVKGDVARIVMYIWVAYHDYYGSSLPAITNTFASYNTLLQWHTLDKPDALEGLRNDFCEESDQENRNPFVDHPEYAWQIFGDSASSSVKAECAAKYPGEGGQATTKTLSSIAVSGTASKTSYTSGESFNPNGLTVTATYDDNSTAVIPNNSCTWSPNPLTEGITSVTCTYEQFAAIYSGITVTKRVVGDTVFSVVFNSSGSDGSSEYTSGSNVFNAELKENTLIKSIDSVSKVFPGEKGLKIGSSKQTGSISFTLVDDAQSKIGKITIKTQKYGSDATEITFKLNGSIVKENITPGTDYVGNFDGVNASTMTISTNQKRAYLVSVILELKADDPDPQPSDSSSQPISSSIEPISSSEPSSSGEPSSIPSSEESSSSEIESIPESSEQMVSSGSEHTSERGEEMVPEDSSNVPEESSSVEPSKSSSSSPESQPKTTGGCTGSLLVTLSLTSFTALIGLAFIAFKKKF